MSTEIHTFGGFMFEVENVKPDGRVSAYSIFADQIRALRSEAGEAGDLGMVEICDSALGGDEEARQRCADAVNDAKAREESKG